MSKIISDLHEDYEILYQIFPMSICYFFLERKTSSRSDRGYQGIALQNR